MPKSLTTAWPDSSRIFSGLTSACTTPWSFTATRRSCLKSWVRYTVAMPPRPSSRSSTYRSARAALRPASGSLTRRSAPPASRRLRHDQRRRAVEPQPLGVHHQVVVHRVVAVAAVVGPHVLVALPIDVVHHLLDAREVHTETPHRVVHTPPLRRDDVHVE